MTFHAAVRHQQLHLDLDLRDQISPAARPVLLSLGMGVDSVAVLTRWLLEPSIREFDLRQLVCVTAMTGDEYQVTGELMERHVLPLMRRHAVRYVQLARAAQGATGRYVVLDDSRCPQRMRMFGPWALSDELIGAGTLPQIVSGKRTCSHRAKGEPIDWWVEDQGLGSSGYRHIIGYAAEETKRIVRDTSYTSRARDPWYVLAHDWGWDRQRCEDYLLDVYGVRWPRSCCVYCPFQAGKGGRDDLAARWRREPAAAAAALVMEHTALAFNPRARLFGTLSAHQVVTDYALDAARRRADAALDADLWALYEVRRIFFPRRDGSGRKGTAWRSVRQLRTGPRQAVYEQLDVAAARHGLDVEVGEVGERRLWLHQADGPPYPCTERLVAAAPVGVADKQRDGFEAHWARLTAA